MWQLQKSLHQAKPLAYMHATSPIEVDVQKLFLAAYIHVWYYPFG